MKALVLTKYNHLEIQEWPRPEIGPDEVLLRVAACGICGSDIHGMDGSTGRRQPPIIMGHEASGTVAEVGRNVQTWKPGDRVTFDSTVYCGTCWHCRRGEINLCDNRRVLGVSCDDYRRHGAFAEYVTVPQHILVRLPDNVTFAQAAMIEPLSIAFHAVRLTRVALGDRAVVVGAGMIGLLVIQALRASGCGQIIAIDVDQRRLDLARKFGADRGLLSDSADVAAEVRGMTYGRGADLAVEAVGISAAVHTAVSCVRKGGQVTLVGNLTPKIDFALQTVVTRELTIRGSCASRGEYAACLDMMACGAVSIDPLVSAVAPLAEGAAWFQRLKAGGDGLLKVILQP